MMAARIGFVSEGIAGVDSSDCREVGARSNNGRIIIIHWAVSS